MMTVPVHALVITTAVLSFLSAGVDARLPPDGPSCSVHGRVLDSTGLPLVGATVSAAPGEVVVVDHEGRYCVAGLAPKGRITLETSLDGFRTEVRQVDLPARAALDVTLQPSGFTDEIVVTATRTSRRLQDVPVRTEVVDKALMRAIGARTLADAVEYTTGVRVESNCQNCNFSQIRLLGLDGPYTQILIDGQPVISSLAQIYGIEQIPARMIERVEIVKGGGSALYGSGSVGGVVNIISREPARTSGVFETRFEAAEGRPNYSNSGSFDWASRDRQTNATGFAQLDDVAPLDLTGDGFTEVSSRQLRAGGGRVGRYLLDGRGKLSGELTVLSETRRGGDQLQRPPEQANIAEWIDSRRIGASATWFHGVSSSLDYRLTLAAADTHRDSYYGTGQDPNAFGVTDNLLLLADSQVNQYVGRHTVSWGGQGTWEDLRDEQPAYARLTDAIYSNVGFFFQDAWAFARGWELVYGLRADRHSAVDRVVASPRMALMISPGDALNIRASVARGFRAPQAFDEDLHLSSVGGEVRFIRLDPDLREERSTNYMLGGEWRPRAWRGQALLELNGFYTELTDLFLARDDDDPATDAVEYLKINHGDARVYGLEANAGWGIGDDFILQGGLVLQRARYAEAEPDFGSRDFFRTPNLYGNLTMTWTTSRLGTAFAGLRYTGSMKAPHFAGFIDEDRLETTPGFVTFDASIAFPAYESGTRRLTVTVAGRNLTNAFQRDLDQGMFRDANYVYGPRFPRALSVGLRVEF
ncbi:MAG TPA: TonB-dependent receptor [Vicinamibacterales bacterium]|nr:TonB-dependent receptor [Vicinamibacterales bacterium]